MSFIEQNNNNKNNTISMENTYNNNNNNEKYSLSKQYDDLFKLVIIGDSGVGKSCFIIKICR